MRALCGFLSWALSFLGMVGGLATALAVYITSGALAALAAGVGVTLSFLAISAVISLLVSIDQRLEAAAKASR